MSDATKAVTISEESAKKQLKIFNEYYEFKTSLVPATSREAVDSAIDRILDAIINGRLTIRESSDGVELVQKFKFPPGEKSEMTYGVLTGKTKVALKTKTEQDNFGKMYALVGSLTGIGDDGIQALKGPDLSLAECIGCLFLQV